MALTQAEIELVVDDIRRIAGQSRLQRVLEPADRTLTFRLRETGATRFLSICTTRDATRLHFVDGKPTQPGPPSAFAMLLRKWLHGAPFESIRQIGGDRVVELEFSVVDPRVERDEQATPERTSGFVIAELAGRVGNVFLLDAERRIIGRQTDEAIAGRELRTGEQWEPPPPPPNSDVGSEVRWDLDELPGGEGKRSRAIANHYRTLERHRRRDRIQARIESGLEDQLERLERRIEHIEEDLDDIENADVYRRRAELLQSAYGEVEKGDESVEVPDYYDDEMPQVDIPLDPRKTLQENIDHYYHQARRYEDAREMVEERLLSSIERRDRVETALDDVRTEGLPDNPRELEELEREWIDDGLLPEPTPATGSGSEDDSDEDRPFRLYRTENGRRMLVGKSASDNDTLTTQIARGRDIWLHARDWPGAHVVMRMHHPDENPDDAELRDAALLAAYFSNGREDTVVEVGYTRSKHVRKTGDLPPGRVFVSNEKTVAVEPDDDRLDALLATRE